MGVPVLTLKGETHASQVGVSLLTAAGMPGLIARDEEHFGAIGASLASDLTKLAAMRSHLRDQLARSTLCDAGEFAADFHKLLLDIAAVRRAQE
jgi:predicted O-linked N-acetylglucosamine transferase (SPINDLY family)